MTSKEVVEAFLRKCKVKRLAEGTVKSYQYSLLTFTNFYAEEIDKLSQDDIDDYLIEISESGLQETTQYNKAKDFRIFVKWCQDQGILSDKLKVPVQKANEPMIHPLDDKQLKLIYEVCLSRNSFARYRDYTLMRLLEESGMRISEAIRLNINDVDLKEGVISITKAKNKKARVTYFTPAFGRELDKYIKLRNNVLKQVNIKSDILFIANQDSRDKRVGKSYSIKTFQHRLNEYGDYAGIPVRVSPHTFRHTFAKNFLFNGGDVFTLQDILGHSSLDMVRRYAKLFNSKRQAVYLDVMSKRKKKK